MSGPLRALLTVLILGLLVVVVLLFRPFEARAHSAEEIAVWEAGWEARVEVAGTMTFQLGSELLDFRLRHPNHYGLAPISASHSPQNGSDGAEPVSGPPDTRDRGMGNLGADVERWAGLVGEHFPADQITTALCVIRHESGGNPDAKNPSSSARGLFQILGSLWAPHFGVSQDSLYDPHVNVSLAAAIWRMDGWGAWSAVTRGVC